MEVGIETIEDFGKGGAFVASENFTGNGHHEGDLHLDLSAVDAVESSVEFGAVEGGVDIIIKLGLASDDGARWGERGFGLGSVAKVSGKLGAGAGNGARK